MRIDICGEYGVPVLERLLENFKAVLGECFMHISVWLPYFNESSLLFVNMKKAIESVKSNSYLILQDEFGRDIDCSTRHEMSCGQLEQLTRPFMLDLSLKNEYHIFISYRWGEYDSSLCEALFTRFTLHHTMHHQVSKY